MFDFRQLRYFVAVAEELSFTRAALRLHLSQPPLSQQIQSLERDLGVRLLERTKRYVALTEPGRVFLEQARIMLAQAEHARSSAASAAAGFSGELRLGYTMSASFHPAWPRSLLRFGLLAPKVRLQLTEMYTELQYTALLAEEIDIGFVRDQPALAKAARKLQIMVIDREPLLLALPAGHALAGRDSLKLAEVSDSTFISQPRELAATLYDRLVQLAAAAGFQPRILFQAQQVNGLLALVAAGMGVALVPGTMRVVHMGGVHYVPLEDADAHMLLAVASRLNDKTPSLRQFLSTVAASAAL